MPKLPRFAAIVLSLILTVGVNVGRGATAPAGYRESEDCRNCISEPYGTWWMHAFTPPSLLGDEEAGMIRRCEGEAGCHDYPTSDVCSWYHPRCDGQPGDDDLRKLDEALASGDAGGVASFLTKNARFASYNTVRQAVQITDCRKRIIASIPVPSELTASLQQ